HVKSILISVPISILTNAAAPACRPTQRRCTATSAPVPAPPHQRNPWRPRLPWSLSCLPVLHSPSKSPSRTTSATPPKPRSGRSGDQDGSGGAGAIPLALQAGQQEEKDGGGQEVL
ncbi:hypothetical protein BRADI_4g17455v3, partial [Brachypodium distachyon]